MRSVLFWGVTQCQVVILYDVLGQCLEPIFRGQEVQLDLSTLTNRHCVTPQKNTDLILCSLSAAFLCSAVFMYDLTTLFSSTDYKVLNNVKLVINELEGM
jgi:hypothetical protein